MISQLGDFEQAKIQYENILRLLPFEVQSTKEIIQKMEENLIQTETLFYIDPTELVGAMEKIPSSLKLAELIQGVVSVLIEIANLIQKQGGYSGKKYSFDYSQAALDLCNLIGNVVEPRKFKRMKSKALACKNEQMFFQKKPKAERKKKFEKHQPSHPSPYKFINFLQQGKKSIKKKKYESALNFFKEASQDYDQLKLAEDPSFTTDFETYKTEALYGQFHCHLKLNHHQDLIQLFQQIEGQSFLLDGDILALKVMKAQAYLGLKKTKEFSDLFQNLLKEEKETIQKHKITSPRQMILYLQVLKEYRKGCIILGLFEETLSLYWNEALEYQSQVNMYPYCLECVAAAKKVLKIKQRMGGVSLTLMKTNISTKGKVVHDSSRDEGDDQWYCRLSFLTARLFFEMELYEKAESKLRKCLSVCQSHSPEFKFEFGVDKISQNSLQSFLEQVLTKKSEIHLPHDLYYQWQRTLSIHFEIHSLLFFKLDKTEDLDRFNKYETKKLSRRDQQDAIQNSVVDITVKWKGILDHIYARYLKSQGLPQKKGYLFPVIFKDENNKKNHQQKNDNNQKKENNNNNNQRKENNNQHNDNNQQKENNNQQNNNQQNDSILKKSKLPDCVKEIQPYLFYDPERNRKHPGFYQKSWLDKLNTINNDSKHVRLTPHERTQTIKKKNRSFVEFLEFSVTIEYLETDPRLHTWSFIDIFPGHISSHEKCSASLALFQILVKGKFINQHGELEMDWKTTENASFQTMIIDLIQIQFQLEKKTREADRKELVKKYIEDLSQARKEFVISLERQFSEENSFEDLVAFNFSPYSRSIANFLLARLFRKYHEIPDSKLDLFPFLESIKKGTTHILFTLSQEIESNYPRLPSMQNVPLKPIETFSTLLDKCERYHQQGQYFQSFILGKKIWDSVYQNEEKVLQIQVKNAEKLGLRSIELDCIDRLLQITKNSETLSILNDRNGDLHRNKIQVDLKVQLRYAEGQIQKIKEMIYKLNKSFYSYSAHLIPQISILSSEVFIKLRNILDIALSRAVRWTVFEKRLETYDFSKRVPTIETQIPFPLNHNIQQVLKTKINPQNNFSQMIDTQDVKGRPKKEPKKENQPNHNPKEKNRNPREAKLSEAKQKKRVEEERRKEEKRMKKEKEEREMDPKKKERIQLLHSEHHIEALIRDSQPWYPNSTSKTLKFDWKTSVCPWCSEKLDKIGFNCHICPGKWDQLQKEWWEKLFLLSNQSKHVGVVFPPEHLFSKNLQNNNNIQNNLQKNNNNNQNNLQNDNNNNIQNNLQSNFENENELFFTEFHENQLYPWSLVYTFGAPSTERVAHFYKQIATANKKSPDQFICEETGWKSGGGYGVPDKPSALLLNLKLVVEQNFKISEDHPETDIAEYITLLHDGISKKVIQEKNTSLKPDPIIKALTRRIIYRYFKDNIIFDRHHKITIDNPTYKTSKTYSFLNDLETEATQWLPTVPLLQKMVEQVREIVHELAGRKIGRIQYPDRLQSLKEALSFFLQH